MLSQSSPQVSLFVIQSHELVILVSRRLLHSIDIVTNLSTITSAAALSRLWLQPHLLPSKLLFLCIIFLSFTEIDPIWPTKSTFHFCLHITSSRIFLSLTLSSFLCSMSSFCLCCLHSASSSTMLWSDAMSTANHSHNYQILCLLRGLKNPLMPDFFFFCFSLVAFKFLLLEVVHLTGWPQPLFFFFLLFAH